MSARPESCTLLDPASERVLRHFRLLLNVVRRHFQMIERETGVGGAQLWAMQIIEARPGIGVCELGRALDIHQTTASNMVRLLVERGFIRASRTGADRRMQSLEILSAGRDVLLRAPPVAEASLPAALAALDPELLSRFDSDLRSLLDALEKSSNA